LPGTGVGVEPGVESVIGDAQMLPDDVTTYSAELLAET
jgi:hypothetical protein